MFIDADKFEFVFGADCEGIYKDGKLIAAGRRLTSMEVFEACGIRVDFWDFDDTIYDGPEKLPKSPDDIDDKRPEPPFWFHP